MVYIVTEQPFNGKVSDDSTNMRTDLVWINALDATHINYDSMVEPNTIMKMMTDTVIFVVSKNRPEYLSYIKNYKGRKFIMQEGSKTLWLDWPVRYQLIYLEILKNVNGILCHNTLDQSYFKSLTDNKVPVEILPTIHYTDKFKDKRVGKYKNSIIIGGNMNSWYGGMHSYLAIKDYDFDRIGITTMGRRQDDEIREMTRHDPRVVYIPYMKWENFMIELKKYEYAIHLMPTVAAGSFYLNCAMVNVPCIGNFKDDNARLLFPDLSVDLSLEMFLWDAKQKVQYMIDNKSKINRKARSKLQIFDAEYKKGEIIDKLESM